MLPLVCRQVSKIPSLLPTFTCGRGLGLGMGRGSSPLRCAFAVSPVTISKRGITEYFDESEYEENPHDYDIELAVFGDRAELMGSDQYPGFTKVYNQLCKTHWHS